MGRRLVLDDFERPDARTLLAPGTQEKASPSWVGRAGRTRHRQVSLGVEVFGDADCVPEDGGVDIIAASM